MCGICGTVALNQGRARHLRDAVEAMTATLVHRGPDEGRTWLDAEFPLGFGHRRLAVIDPTPSGAQPMISRCGRYVLVTNGEIYNHMELRDRLAAEGRAPNWNGHSDTETMLACLAAWGPEKALRAFEGMFAFACWDRRERTLTIARDRMGEKPLYYGWQGNTFLFASELKAIRAHPDFSAYVDRRALSAYLRYAYVPAPHSIYSGIHKLMPGHFVRFDLAAGEPDPGATPHAYWQLSEAVWAGRARAFEGSDEEAADALEQIVRGAVAKQMISDVPLGAFLSGGIDSSLVVSLMQQISDRPVKTFTIGNQVGDLDEARYARKIADHLGTDHTELMVTDRMGRDVVPKLSRLYCEPFADSSQIPTFLVSELARRDVTVALSGDGGDELFGGYNRYLAARSIWSGVRTMPGFSRGAIRRLLTSLSPRAWDRVFGLVKPMLPRSFRVAGFGDKTAKLAQVLQFDTEQDFYRDLVSHWKDPSGIVVGGSEPATVSADPANGSGPQGFEQWMMAMDAVTYMPDDIFAKVDRASMGNSLEVRVPLVSPEVVNFAWSLPLSMKIRNGTGKWLMRQVLYRHVPKSLIERPKMGFGIPLGDWLRGPLRDWAEDLLGETRLRDEGYFDPAPIRAKWRDHLAGKRSWQYDLWDVLMFQSWLEGQGRA